MANGFFSYFMEVIDKIRDLFLVMKKRQEYDRTKNDSF